jgi:hypothetical protein
VARSNNDNRLLPPEVAIGFYIVRFLNEESSDEKVLKVFELCHELDQLRRGRIDASDDLDLNENAQQTVVTLAKLNAVLDDFRFVPVIGGLDQYVVLWRAATRRPASTEAGPPILTAESLVKVILEMTEDGTIERVRKCLCGRWFLAQTNKKVVCSDACRFRKFKQQSDEGFNKDRAQYMRGYRRDRKKRAAKRKGNHAKKK